MDVPSSYLFIDVRKPDMPMDAESMRAIRSTVTAAHYRQRHGINRKQEYQAVRIESQQKANQNESTSRPANTLLGTRSPNPSSTAQAPLTFMLVDPTKKPSKEVKTIIRRTVAKKQQEDRRKAQLESLLPHQEHLQSDSLSPSSPPDLPPGHSFSSEVPFDWCPSPLPVGNTYEVPVSAQVYLSNQSPPALAVPRNLEDPTTQLHHFARQLGTDATSVWTRYLWQEREHGQLFHAQYARLKGRGQKYLHPLILAHPAILASTVLFTGCLMRQQDYSSISDAAIMHLRSLAYELAQSTINDWERSEDATMLAVLKLAMLEAFFGDRDIYRIHMQALVQMVHLRQGLTHLGMDGYLAHLLLWFDANLSTMTNSPRYLAEAPLANAFKEATPDDESFSLGVKLFVASDSHWEQLKNARHYAYEQ